LGNIEGFVGNTVKLTSDGAQHLDKYSGQMQLISENLEETANFIQTLSSNLSEISVFGNLIMNITGQLHLLSLNSRVEAARAGEAGRGFSVVAQEMNKLSDATKDSVTQINKLLENIINSNTKVSESIAHVTNTFGTSKEIFQSVKTSFDTINSNANILNNDIKKVYEESLMISDSTKEISVQSSVLHDASNEISCITQDVAAITEEELAENEEINNQAISLKRMLSSIENLLKKYRTSVLPADKVSEKRLKFVMLSPANEPFWESVRQGALYAQTELKDKNVEVEFIGFDKIDHSFIDTLNKVIDTGCDGLVLPGFVKGIEECVDRAAVKKIPIMAFNCDLADETKRLSYFGPNVAAEGALAVEMLARSIDEKGEIVIFSGSSKSPIHEKRREAATAALYRYDEIRVVGTIDNMENNIDVYKKLKDMLNYLTNINGVLVIGQGAPGAARIIEEMKLVGKVKLLCFDYNSEIVELIKKGIVHKVFRQDPFSQGHDPIIYLYNYLVANEVPEKTTYTRTEVIDNYSVSDS
jgi:methyl-accepting chemotaxis protein/ribose transport system substrate-binding protein